LAAATLTKKYKLMNRTSPLIIKETKEDFSFWLSREFVSDEISLNNS
jgi:hypothetical protein